MKISILTICPELFGDFRRSHAVSRAEKLGLLTLEVIDIRNFAGGSFRSIDDSPFGGGRGLLLRCAPVLKAISSVKGEDADSGAACLTVIPAPVGTPYTQDDARAFAGTEHLILVCGHYEGLDERILSRADRIVSLGDYIVTGGELPAMVIADSVIRLLKGNLKEGSASDESFENGLLEYPQYTQPAEYEGERVPEVLLSGDHARIRRWRLKESLRRTASLRPDLLEGRHFTEEERKLLSEIAAEGEGPES